MRNISLLVGGTNFNISNYTRFVRVDRVHDRFRLGFFTRITIAGTTLPVLHGDGNEVVFASSTTTVFSVPFRSFCSTAGSTVRSLAYTLTGRLGTFKVDIYTIHLNSIGANFATTERGSFTKSSICNNVVSGSISIVRGSRVRNVGPRRVTTTIVGITRGGGPPIVIAINAGCGLFYFLTGVLPRGATGGVMNSVCVPG